MIQSEQKVVMRAIALCFKRFLKTEEALIYTNLERTQFAKKCAEAGIVKNASGYYSREQLDNMMGREEI
ncbi:hypothetical protein [Deminuibacter soli]|uniref:Uncharacterized protein n=1 Tax=Deminuibacter soli TaxID=2291815 RepID=A0A3E1NGN9_9BACT|nr:hypothetical protein [Deminuibacter soli]RFM26994.1 hypothetical protein DXN05_16055 [Deminuibacter soli]